MQKQKVDHGSVVVVLFDGRGRMLLIHENVTSLPLYWKFVTGGIESSDGKIGPWEHNPAGDAAAKRETLEETGLVVDVLPLAKICRSARPIYLYAGFAENFDGRLTVGNDGEINRVLSSAKEVFNLENLLPSHRPILQMVVGRLRA